MNFAKKFISIILCVCVVMSVMGASISVKCDSELLWYDASSIIGVVTKTDELIARVSINGIQQSLCVSFPVTGGVRITLGEKGFFEPEALCQLETVSNQNGILTIRAKESGASVSVNRSKTPWSIEVHDPDGEAVTSFSGADMLFGYTGSELSQVALKGDINQNEYFYGLGERFDNFILNGTTVDLWNRDKWSQDGTSYKNLPILNSSRGYMLFFNTSYRATADIGDSNPDKYSLEFKGPKFDFYVFTGERDDINAEYTSLTGKSYLPPKWAFRYWAGEATLYWESEGADKSVELLENVLNGYENYGINDLSAIYGESTLYKYPESFELLKPSDTKLLAWTNPFVLMENLVKMFPDNSIDPLDNALPRLRVPNKNSYTESDVIDFTHPLAKEIVSKQWSEAIDNGVRGLMVDYCEYVPEDSVSYNGTVGAEYHNQYAYDYTKTYYELFSSKLDNDFILFSRSAAAGSQKYAAVFSGDQTSDFDGLTRAVKALLSLSSCGFSTWGSDIGGLGVPQSSEVFMRWTQFAAMSPLMRLHGQGSSDPWNFGEQAEQSFQTHYWLRENLINKIYSSAVTATISGKPMSQSMVSAFEKQLNLHNIDDQYMFCDDFLVCPVTVEGAVSRDVTLPLGNWVDLWTGELISGARVINADAPVTHSPIYIKSGAAIPVVVSSETLSLADKISDSAQKVDALLVTAPDGKRESIYYTSENDRTVFSNKAVSENAFTISADKTRNERVILAYGIDAAEVLVDSKPLKMLNSEPINEVGFYNGEKGAVIRCDGDWNEIKIVIKSVSYGDDTQLPDIGEKSQSMYLRENNALAEDVFIDVPTKDNFDVFHTSTAADTSTVMTATDFSDRFNTYSGYTQHIWNVDSVDYSTQKDNVLTTALYNGKKYRDFELSVEFKGTINPAGHSSAMLVFGVEDPVSAHTRENGGFLVKNTNDGNSVLSGYINGEYKELSDPFNYRVNGKFKNNWDSWYKMTVRVEGQTATVTIDPMLSGYTPYSYSYTLGADYTGGFVGFAANCQISKYRNFSVTDLGGEVLMDLSFTLAGEENTEYLFDAFYGSNADEDGLEPKKMSEAFVVSNVIGHAEGPKITDWALQDKDITSAVYTVKPYRDFEMTVKMSGSMGDASNAYYWPMLIFGVEDPTDWVQQEGGGYCVGTYNEGNTFFKGFEDGGFVSACDPTFRNDSTQRAENGFFVANNYSWWYLTVRVEGQTATVTVEPGYYWGEGETWAYSYTYNLSDSYKGGYIGFGSSAAKTYFWNIQIKDLGGEVLLDANTSLGNELKNNYLLEAVGDKKLYKLENFINFEAQLEGAKVGDALCFGKDLKTYVCPDGSIAFEGTVCGERVTLNKAIPNPTLAETFTLSVTVSGYEATVSVLSDDKKEYSAVFRIGKNYCGGRVGYCADSNTVSLRVKNNGKSYYSSSLAGDCDLNGRLNAEDMCILRRLLLKTLESSAIFNADTNWDGQTDIRDLIGLKKALAIG